MPTSLYFLLWGALISCLVFFATEREFLEALRRRWLPLGLILFLALVWRLPFEGHFFYGLEYEDSYIYSVAGRSLDSGTRNCAHAAQRVEHYEIAAYGTVRAFAERLGENEHVSLLSQTLEEEKQADKKLTEVSQEISSKAVQVEDGTSTPSRDGRSSSKLRKAA
jgi:hypothetical protein